MVRLLHIQVDNMPGRNERTNLQEEAYQEWLLRRRQLTETDRILADMRLRLKQLDEMNLRQAR
jgi:hypothetical protein